MNNNDVDAMMIEPLAMAEASVPSNTEEAPLTIGDVPDLEILSSDDGPITFAGSTGISNRVRERKWTSAKASNPPAKRKFDIPTPFLGHKAKGYPWQGYCFSSFG